jgi:pimeloyl-ACP methyl ester carboxylesterase
MLALAATLLSAGAATPASSATIDSLEDITLGGVREKILIQGDDVANPLLLWLHGGPGEPAMFLSHHFSSVLKKHMTIVHWDQPGTGLSYDPEHPLRELSAERIERDALELVDKLLKRFGRKKLYVLGHSFGSVIGMRLVASYPDRFCAYVGMGQVVNGPKSIQLTRDWLKTEMTRANDREGLGRLAGASFVDVFDMVKARGGILHGKVDYRAILTSSPYYFDGYWELKKKARAATRKLVTKANGGTQGFAIDQIRTLRVPAFYFTGRYDRVPATAPELVADYVQRLRAPHKEIVWFENSGHLPNLEEPLAFQDAIIGKVKAMTTGCGLADQPRPSAAPTKPTHDVDRKPALRIFSS